MKKKLIEMNVELFEEIENSAAKENRSVNKEIIHRLEKSIENDKRTKTEGKSN